VGKEEVAGRITSLLEVVGDWVFERAAIDHIFNLYKDKISLQTARNYVLEFEERDEVRVGQAETPDGRIVRALRL
jgi:hypothetical protein